MRAPFRGSAAVSQIPNEINQNGTLWPRGLLRADMKFAELMAIRPCKMQISGGPVRDGFSLIR